eukprot:Gregarina_sp_Poly_1__9926@NODE_652_length_6929_cov_76_457010_g495_i0_p4_GENE_NODE_652_length_6929_cov_76_457010_g495_i0NODE_652_length_6929_cov_76_457010_g495_i0_p4_ORF_typecomplete_len113_score7_27_NODE_652_length_6929_cov_76_457010_g495_i060316369
MISETINGWLNHQRHREEYDINQRQPVLHITTHSAGHRGCESGLKLWNFNSSVLRAESHPLRNRSRLRPYLQAWLLEANTPRMMGKRDLCSPTSIFVLIIRLSIGCALSFFT